MDSAQAIASCQQTLLTALQEVEDNLVIAGSLQQVSGLQTKALVAANRSLDIVKNQYQSGRVRDLNVLMT